jgi:hypothetical protein
MLIFCSSTTLLISALREVDVISFSPILTPLGGYRTGLCGGWSRSVSEEPRSSSGKEVRQAESGIPWQGARVVAARKVDS